MCVVILEEGEEFRFENCQDSNYIARAICSALQCERTDNKNEIEFWLESLHTEIHIYTRHEI